MTTETENRVRAIKIELKNVIETFLISSYFFGSRTSKEYMDILKNNIVYTINLYDTEVNMTIEDVLVVAIGNEWIVIDFPDRIKKYKKDTAYGINR